MQDCQVTSSEALCTALQHPALTADPQTVCCLLLTCRSWRAAVQQAAAGTTIIDLPSLHSIAKLSQFAAWLPRHAGMLAEIVLTCPQTACDGLSTQNYATAAEQIILLALQNVAAAAAASAAIPAAGVPQPLRLRVFCTDFLSGPGLLAAIPAATLTKLSAKHMSGYPSANSPAISQALAGLTSLRTLCLENYYAEPAKLGAPCLQAIAQLSCLSELRLAWTAADADLSLLPPQLQVLDLSASCGGRPLQLQHLTGLRALRMDVVAAPALGSVLPPQLQQLSVSSWSARSEHDEGHEPSSYAACKQHSLQHVAWGALQQLTSLYVMNGLCEPQLMHRVACLPQLVCVQLHYTEASLARSAAPGWQHLPQLKELHVDDARATPMDEENTETFMEYVGAATSLTSLHISGRVLDGDAPICKHLTGLYALLELELDYAEGPNSREDALHLTMLTGLTQLVLAGAPGVDDVCAVAIASWLRWLQHLELRSCGLTSAAALPAIGALTQLRRLCLAGYGHTGIVGSDIMLLTRLIGLKKEDEGAGVNFDDTFDDDAIAAFGAGLIEALQEQEDMQGIAVTPGYEELYSTDSM